MNRGLKCFTNPQLNLENCIVELKKWIEMLCKELIKSEYSSETALPRIITLELFQAHFSQINGIVTHWALGRIFKSMRAAKDMTNEEKQEWAAREWKQDDCDCEDPYRYGLPCRHMLVRSLMQKIPISPS